MYTVQVMAKQYTVTHVRERLSDALDAADRGESIVIVRRGTRYVLALAPDMPRRAARRTSQHIEVLDDAVAAGQWTWDLTARGLKFRARRSR
jgi:antitoxin (DNA-binding transcriptional repressor) of toxin-antitoxin stability system